MAPAAKDAAKAGRRVRLPAAVQGYKAAAAISRASIRTTLPKWRVDVELKPLLQRAGALVESSRLQRGKVLVLCEDKDEQLARALDEYREYCRAVAAKPVTFSSVRRPSNSQRP